MTYNPTAVYLIKNDWSDCNYKIGISNFPDRRSTELDVQYSNVYPILITSCWFPSTKTARKAEHHWHKYFASQLSDDHGGIEWFGLTEEHVSLFTDWAKMSMDGLDIKQWIFSKGATTQELSKYSKDLIKAIPSKRSVRRTIDVWFSPIYTINNGSQHIRDLEAIARAA